MLVNFFHLVPNRSFCWKAALVLFLSSACYADFSVSDSATLNQIAIDVAHAANASQGSAVSLAAISSDTAYLTGVVFDSQQNLSTMQSYLYRLSYAGLRSVTNGIWRIFDKLNTDSQRHLSGPDTSMYYDSIYVHDVRTDDIYNRLGSIEGAINNLTNFLCYSPEYVNSFVSAINTNFPALFSYIPDSQTQYRNLFLYLYGHRPTTVELDRFTRIVQNYGVGNWLLLSNFLDIYFWALPDDVQMAIGNLYSSSYPLPFDDDSIDSLSWAKYTLYGTLQLTENSAALTNLLNHFYSSFSNSLVAVSGHYSSAYELDRSIREPVEYDDSTGRVRNSSGVLSAVGDLADDCLETLPMISTNVVAANTNAIVNIEDNGYNTAINDIRNANPTDSPGDFEGILTDINSEQFSQDLIDVLSESTEECVFTFDLSGFNLAPSSKKGDIPFASINLTVADVKNTTNDYVNFFCSFLECFLVLYFGALLWDVIYQSGTQFYK